MLLNLNFREHAKILSFGEKNIRPSSFKNANEREVLLHQKMDTESPGSGADVMNKFWSSVGSYGMLN